MRHKRIAFPRFYVLLLALLSTCVLGVSAEPGYLEPASLAKEAASVTTKTYPEADTVYLDEVTRIEYQPNGTYFYWNDNGVKILTEKGRAGMTMLTLPYNQFYGKMTVSRLQLIDDKGHVTDLPADKLSRVVTDNSDMSSNIYDPNQKLLVVAIPNVKVGDIVRFLIEYTEQRTPMPDVFSSREIMEYDSPIIRKTVQILAPKERPLVHTLMADTVGKTVTYSKQVQKDGRTLHTWNARNVPQAFPEPKMPSFSVCVQRSLVSTLTQWEEISRWVWKSFERHLQTSPEMKEKTRELTKEAKDDMERIRAIFRFVSQEIRYMGETNETVAPGFEPHDVVQTFTKRHGVCRDKAGLLVAMLRDAGFQAFPVLIHAGDRLDPRVPMLRFNHAITAVRLNGEYILMDSTDEQTKSLLPEYLVNRSYLVATPEGETLRVTPVPPAEDNLLDIATTCTIDAQGNLQGRTFLSMKGLMDNAYRGSLATMSQEYRQTWLQKKVSQILDGAQLVHYEIHPENILNISDPITIELHYTVQDFISRNGETAFFTYPSFASFGIRGNIFRGISLSKRRFPYMSRYPLAEHEKVSIHIDPSLGRFTAFPETQQPQVSDTLERLCSASIENNLLKVETKTAFRAVQYSPEQYQALKSSTADLARFMRTPIILNRTLPREAATHSPDISVIKRKTDYVLVDRNSWSETYYVKYQILTYAGKEHSDISIKFIPEYQTAKMDFARVYSNGQVQELNLKENKYMDQDWVGQAPRYTPGKILIANLPGVEVGSIVEYQYTLTHINGTVFSIQHPFRSYNPIQYESLSIKAPKSLKLNIHCSQNGILGQEKRNALAANKHEEKGSILYTWTAGEMEAIPEIVNLPSDLRAFVPFVQCTAGSRNEHLADLSKAIDRCSVSTPELKKFVDKLAYLEPEEKVIAIRNHVALNIRNAGPSFLSLPFDKLSPAATTFKDCYGHDADIVILLNTLLKEAGFSPEIVLVRPLRCSQAFEQAITALYAPETFSAILLRVKINGKTIWLNDGTQYAEPGTCNFEGHRAMTLDGTPFVIEAPENYRELISRRINITLREDGSATLTSHIAFFGGSNNQQRKRFAEMTPDERDKYHQGLISSLSHKATAKGPLLLETSAYPTTCSFTAQIPDFASVQNGIISVPDALLSMAIAGTGLLNRKVPAELNGAQHQTCEVTITFPKDYTEFLSLPKAFRLTFGGNSFISLKTTVSGNRVTLTQHIQVSPSWWNADEYPNLLALNKRLGNDALRLIIAQKQLRK